MVALKAIVARTLVVVVAVEGVKNEGGGSSQEATQSRSYSAGFISGRVTSEIQFFLESCESGLVSFPKQSRLRLDYQHSFFLPASNVAMDLKKSISRG